MLVSQRELSPPFCCYADLMADAADDSAGSTVICHRCGVELTPGEGNFWIVRIDAVCDPSPPVVDPSESLESLAAEYEMLLAEMSEMSEQELKDQVYQRVVVHLCSPCFRRWIDRPVD